MSRKKIVILGAGFGGAYAAKEILKLVSTHEAEVIVIDRNDYILYYPLLAEAATGIIEARHVVVPIRLFLKPKAEFMMADVESVDVKNNQVTIQQFGSEVTKTLDFDYLIYALGSVTKKPTIPGFDKFGFEFKTLSDGISLRDRAIQLLEEADILTDSDSKREKLRFLVVGANFSGVELAGEYYSFLLKAAKAYTRVQSSDINVVLIEYGKEILASMAPDLRSYVFNSLTKRGVTILTENTVIEISENSALLKSGETLATSTVIWTAGIAPDPTLIGSGMPLNGRGYVECEETLLVTGSENIWAIGDAASVENPAGKFYAATAQNASRQGPIAAKNLVATMKQQKQVPFTFKPLGAIAAFGDKKAAAEVFGLHFKGFVGWVIFRSIYLFKMPTFRLKIRLGMDWFLDFFLPFPPVQLGLHDDPRSTTLD